MKKITLLLFASIILSILLLPNAGLTASRNGYILLQVEDNGEAWYVYPENGKKYYLGRPADAFAIMRKFALGAKHDFINNTEIFPERLSGYILLDVEAHGEAYYIYPRDRKKYYLGRPADAFTIMRELGQGISNIGLTDIPTGHTDEQEVVIETADKILFQVPFTSQAPFGDWNDQRQQDGCEESSALMAMKWVRGEELTPTEALRIITGLSDYLLDKYGEYRDVSSADVVDWIFKDYFEYDKVELKKNITANDMINELHKGNLVITAMNGRMMNNPHFTPPGPPRHMLVIRGYDPAQNVFITNDPGTRYGEGFEYNAEAFFEAIRDYPTGYHETITEIQKNMIVISR